MHVWTNLAMAGLWVALATMHALFYKLGIDGINHTPELELVRMLGALVMALSWGIPLVLGR